ncbi:hypothetical protein NHQ30_002451 [Ciborinia camelliae]|nr:hypothetical protein NHQ30_002451 [Ciborinia camelliae]
MADPDAVAIRSTVENATRLIDKITSSMEYLKDLKQMNDVSNTPGLSGGCAAEGNAFGEPTMESSRKDMVEQINGMIEKPETDEDLKALEKMDTSAEISKLKMRKEHRAKWVVMQIGKDLKEFKEMLHTMLPMLVSLRMTEVPVSREEDAELEAIEKRADLLLNSWNESRSKK